MYMKGCFVDYTKCTKVIIAVFFLFSAFTTAGTLFLDLGVLGMTALPCLAGDATNDCEVTLNDLALVARFGMEDCSMPDCPDLDGNPGVSPGDLLFVGDNWLMATNPNLLISEFMARNQATVADGGGLYSDWIEIANVLPHSMSLEGWYLTDSLSDPYKWAFPDDVQIPAGGVMAFFASNQPTDYTGNNSYQDRTGYYHTNFSLDASGEDLILVEPGGKIAHAILDYPSQPYDLSYGIPVSGQSSDALIPRYFGIPTFDAVNDTSLHGLSDKVAFSHESQCFANSFDLVLSKETEVGLIRYTLDGSEPTSASAIYSGPIIISSSTEVRARITATNYAPGPVSGCGFIKIKSGGTDFVSTLPVVVLENFGGGTVSGSDKTFTLLSFEPNPEIGISSLSNMPDDSTRCGIHTRGSSSRNWEKKQLKVETRNQEGLDKDISLLGLPEESDWVLNAPYADKSLIRNAFMFDLARDIGLLAPRTRHCEVFIDDDGDGLELSVTGDDYVGVYVLMESIKRGKNRVDIPEIPLSVKAETGSVPEIISGGYIMRFDTGQSDPVIYRGNHNLYLLDGNASKFKYNAEQLAWITNYAEEAHAAIWSGNYETHIDVDSWVNLLVLNELGRDQDSYFRSNYMYKDRGGKFVQGPMWDFNLTLGLGSSRNCSTYDGWQFQENNGFEGTEWMQRLMSDVDFTQKFIDRWQECRRNQMALDRMLAKADALAAEITTTAANRNFTQYPTLNSSTPFTPSGSYGLAPDGISYRNHTLTSTWQEQVDYVKSVIGWRLGWVDSQFVSLPQFSPNGGQVPLILTITQPEGKAIYYTTNGSDPRASGGGIAGTRYTGSIFIASNTRIRARAYDSSRPNTSNPDSGRLATRWSGIQDVFFSLEPQAQPGDIVITEFNYNPAAPTQAEYFAGHGDNNSFEFIELRNISGAPLNLFGVNFVNGIDFTFGDVVMDNDEHIVLVKDQSAFEARYGSGLPIGGTYLGSLDNNGEEIDMEDMRGVNLVVFDYKDGWFDSTDGAGFTLVTRDPFNTDPDIWDDKDGWQPSSVYNGTPGEENSTTVPPLGSVVINEVLAHSNIAAPYDYIELYNTTDQPINITGWHLSDNYTPLDPASLRYEIGVETPVIIGADDYVVFYEDQHFGSMSSDPGKNTGFQFSESGEIAYLFYGGQSALEAELFENEDFGASRADVSHGLYLKSTGATNFVAMEGRTPGDDNEYPKVGPIVITEIMYHPNTNVDAEYVELRNISGSSVTLYDSSIDTGWRFVDDGSASTPDLSFDFPIAAPVTLADGERMLLVKNRSAFDSIFDSLGTLASTGIIILEWVNGSLSNGGEKPQISMPGNLEDTVSQYIRIDRISYDDTTPWPTSPNGGGDSLHRIIDSDYGNDVVNWTAGAPSPGL